MSLHPELTMWNALLLTIGIIQLQNVRTQELDCSSPMWQSQTVDFGNGVMGLTYRAAPINFGQQYISQPVLNSRIDIFKFNSKCNLNLHSLHIEFRSMCRVNVTVAKSVIEAKKEKGVSASGVAVTCTDSSAKCWASGTTIPLQPHSIIGQVVAVRLWSMGSCFWPIRTSPLGNLRTHATLLATDVDECKLASHSCRSDQICKNTIGSHLCLPNTGFIRPRTTPSLIPSSTPNKPTTLVPSAFRSFSRPTSATRPSTTVMESVTSTLNLPESKKPATAPSSRITALSATDHLPATGSNKSVQTSKEHPSTTPKPSTSNSRTTKPTSTRQTTTTDYKLTEKVLDFRTTGINSLTTFPSLSSDGITPPAATVGSDDIQRLDSPRVDTPVLLAIILSNVFIFTFVVLAILIVNRHRFRNQPIPDQANKTLSATPGTTNIGTLPDARYEPTPNAGGNNEIHPVLEATISCSSVYQDIAEVESSTSMQGVCDSNYTALFSTDNCQHREVQAAYASYGSLFELGTRTLSDTSRQHDSSYDFITVTSDYSVLGERFPTPQTLEDFDIYTDV